MTHSGIEPSLSALGQVLKNYEYVTILPIHFHARLSSCKDRRGNSRRVFEIHHGFQQPLIAPLQLHQNETKPGRNMLYVTTLCRKKHVSHTHVEIVLETM